MVKHIIVWTLKDMPADEKESVKAGVKAGLEGLMGKIPGLLSIKVIADGRLDTCNSDLMLDSAFESPEALKGYIDHPDHVAVATTKVRPFMSIRSSFDYVVE